MLNMLSWIIPALGLSLAILYFVLRYAESTQKEDK